MVGLLADLSSVRLFCFVRAFHSILVSGDLDVDAASVRICESKGIEFIVCQSFSKNMGLYGEWCPLHPAPHQPSPPSPVSFGLRKHCCHEV